MKTVYDGFEKQLIAGKWVSGKDSAHVNIDINPYTQEKILQIPCADRSDVDRAYTAAAEAQHDWAENTERRIQVMERAATIMEERREEIISWLVRESGSTRIKAQIELDSAIRMTKYTAGYPLAVSGEILPSAKPGETSRVYREPVGVIGIISPWNFPFHLTMRSLAPALALGNTAVLKPASNTPVTGGLLCAKIFEEAGVPAGVFSVVVGSGSVIGDHFVEHPVPSFISFTGSSAVGKRIGQKSLSGEKIKKVALELGGNSPLIILDDADIDKAVEAAVMGRFLHSGQICMSTNRVIVDQKVHDEFVAKLLPAVKRLKVGDPDRPDTLIGPIIDKEQLKSVTNKLQKAIEDGADVLLGGDIMGNIIPPYILDHVDPEWEIAKEEIFGPVLPIITAKDENDALRLANDTQYGLSSSVFTRSFGRGLCFARGIRAGMTHINDITVDDQVNAPFGGEKNSGIGRFNGNWIVEEFTSLHWITSRHES